tara:strand:+ start:1710 stop:2510 length:801 start_codon:yes stop_codon:yes gene_type:complete
MDYYNILGVAKNATDADIKKAYRKLAKTSHPDRTGGDDTQFKRINEAYETLKNPVKRQQYDTPQHHIDMNAQNMHDIFGNMFRQPVRMRKNQDVTINVRITLNDVMTGKDIIGRYRLSTGREEIANIRLPAGVESGLIMRYTGLGDDAVHQLPRGDLNVRVIVENHPNFVRDRLHIRTICSINVLALILGTQVVVTDLAGRDINVKIPAGTNPGTILSIAGHGLPDINTGKSGNLYLEVKGKTPKIDDWDMLEEVRKIYNGTNTST